MPAEFAEPLEMIDATHVRWRGRRMVYFGGCDYLRLSVNPTIRAAMEKGVINVAASRMTTGNHPVYAHVEKAIAAWFRVPSATLCSSGYLTAIAVGQALEGEVDRVLIDERAHGCLRDAARLTGAEVVEFCHRDVADLARRIRSGRLLLMTDGVFAADGAIAPLRDYLKALPRGARMLVDDAHGAGVLGENGRGSTEFAAVGHGQIIRTITFSKAFGVYGGAILGSMALRRRLMERSRAVVGNTPLPPMYAHGILAALKLATPAKRRRLMSNARRLMPGAEFPVLSFESENAERVCGALIEAGIHPPWIRYPGGASKGFFRFAVSSGHTPAQLRDLVAVLRQVGQ